MKRCVLGALAVVLVTAAPARADNPETRPRRGGVAFGVALGPAVFLGSGSGLSDVQGVGGDLDLRIGTSAGPRLLWFLQLESGGYQIDHRDLAGKTATTYNVVSSLAVTGQVYVRPVLWLRGGAGVASFLERAGGKGGPIDADSQRAGIAAVAGGGYDFFRRRGFAVDFELSSTLSFFRDGAIGRSSGMLGLVWY
jgi:hypothetical protein